MRRREFITAIAGLAAAWPLVAYAQQPDRVRRVGVLLPFDENDPEAKNRIRQFRLGMRDLDWIEGRYVLIDFWFSADNLESTKRSVAELIKAAPEVIVAYGTPGLAAVRPATSTIPIVFDFVGDPVGQGFVPSLATPEAISRGSRPMSRKSSENGSTCLAS
jgi:putative ABC transport system substrate-binding protein